MVNSIINIVQNYILIQFAILIFFAPFYLVYKYNHNKAGLTHITFNLHLENFFSSRQANYLVFLWAASEAIVWFVIPEFLLLLIIFLRIRKKIELLIYDILGTAIGTVLAFFIPITRNEILQIPYIQENMIKQVEVWYQHMGIFGLIFQPFSGVPYKAFTLTAHEFNFFIPIFIIFGILVRITRYYFLYLIFSGIYPLLHRFVYRNYIPMFLMSCFLFSLLLLKVYNLYGSGYEIDYSFIDKLNYFNRIILNIK